MNHADAPGARGLDPEYQRRLSEAYTDDITWLTIGKGLLERTIPTLNEQARNLGTSVGWFWTVYSSTVVVAAIVSTPRSGGLGFLLVVPVFTILVSYLLALAAQSPVLNVVDLRSVDEIRAAVQRTTRKKIRLLRGCSLALVITAVLIGAGVVAQMA